MKKYFIVVFALVLFISFSVIANATAANEEISYNTYQDADMYLDEKIDYKDNYLNALGEPEEAPKHEETVNFPTYSFFEDKNLAEILIYITKLGGSMFVDSKSSAYLLDHDFFQIWYALSGFDILFESGEIENIFDLEEGLKNLGMIKVFDVDGLWSVTDCRR